MPNITDAREKRHEGARQSYDPDFFSHLAKIESAHFWFRTRNQVIATLVEQITRNWPDGYKVLEVGCGAGNVLGALKTACPHGLVVGMDLYAEGLAYARERASCPLVQGDIEQPAFGAPFDLVGAFDVVEHLSDDIRIFRSLHSMLKADGVLLLTVPAHQSLWSYFDEVSHHCRRYEPDDLRRKLTQTGFEIEFLSQFMATIYPLLMVVRRTRSFKGAEKSTSADADRSLAMKEFRIVPVINEILTFVLMQEAKLIKSRIALPFGSSLVVVARRTQ